MRIPTITCLLALSAGLIAADAAAEARQTFDTICATCHGKTGRADTPAGQALKPKPASFADPAWQAGISDEQIETVIVKGGAAVGKAPTMPPNPALADKPEVVAALRAIIRGLKP